MTGIPFRLRTGVMILAFALLLPGYVCAASATLTLPTIESAGGSEIDVPLTIKGGKGVSALQALLLYDPAVLEVVSDASDPDKAVTRGAIVPTNAIAKVYTTTPGRLPIIFVGGATAGQKEIAAITGDGTLLTIRFRVTGGPRATTALTLERAQAFQVNDMDLLVKTEAGVVTVSRPFPWLWIVIAAGGTCLLLLLIVMLSRRRPVQ